LQFTSGWAVFPFLQLFDHISRLAGKQTPNLWKADIPVGKLSSSPIQRFPDAAIGEAL